MTFFYEKYGEQFQMNIGTNYVRFLETFCLEKEKGTGPFNQGPKDSKRFLQITF